VLDVRVGGDELRAVDALLVHSVDGVAAGTATADDRDVGLEVLQDVFQFVVGHCSRLMPVFRAAVCRSATLWRGVVGGRGLPVLGLVDRVIDYGVHSWPCLNNGA